MAEQQQAAQPRRGREGARWINERPTPEEFGTWFRENVKIHEGLNAEDYVGGVVLIPVSDEKVKYVKGYNAQGAPVIDTRPELYFVPYAKVEARVAYFWDLLELQEDKWFGVVEPIPVSRPSAAPVPSSERILDGDRIVERDTSRAPVVAQIVEQLPEGFGLMPVPVGNTFTHFLVCSYRVAIYSRDHPERPLREGRGTKMVPLVIGRNTPFADQNSIMKAETGAMGRAMGMAGIFTIPGSGVATAEDMIDAATAQPTAQQGDPEAAVQQTGPAAPAEPAVREPAASAGEAAADEHQTLVARAKELVNEAHADYPGVLEAFREWGQQRNPPVTNLGNLSGAALRGAVRKLERLLDEAKQAASQREGEAAPAPAEPDAAAPQASSPGEEAPEPVTGTRPDDLPPEPVEPGDGAQ